ncbi:hypothetical protein DM02DRAFT_610596 [Periconia macrospinosa]|uniref:Uncharacterized protein n=1 Tax=Periconia macrospinosa TaxID=97972 RepID=A0A2V1E654_9PLEO|nr:hypothetical protein DM02DRAFT_610596 [Periconia macrospinosa]
MGHVFSCLKNDIDCDYKKKAFEMTKAKDVGTVPAGPYMFNGQLYHVQPDECNSHGGTWSEEEAGCHVVVNEALCNAYKGHWDNEVCTVDFDQFQQGVTAASTHKLAAREVNVEHYDIANNLIICALFMAALLIFVIIGTIFFTRRILVKSLKIRDAESQPRPDSASSSKSAEGENGVSCK